MDPQKASIYVNSEVGRLKKVIVHRPEQGIARVSPKRSEELLFDDIVYLPQIQEEHDVFTAVLRKCMGDAEVIYMDQLLLEALNADQRARAALIADIVQFEELPSRNRETLSGLDNETLTGVLISGYLPDPDIILFDPIPNFIFTRDIAVTIHDHVVITKAAKEARYRENLLTSFVFFGHPMFAELVHHDRIIDMNDVELFPRSIRGEAVSLEGGDVMLLAEDYLLIGCSERTTQHAIQCLRDVVFARGVVDNVVQINIPKDRAYMHIDTIFTRISKEHIVCYRPLVYDGLSSYVTVYRLVALKSGVAITYDRNISTQEALADFGYRGMYARDFLASDLDLDALENTIIRIPSSELSRARGGSHCMTLPILRN